MRKRATQVGRVTAATIVMAILFVALQVTMALPASAASISLLPTSGVAGSIVLVQGSGFLPDVPVAICWINAGCSNLGRADPDASGDFSITISIADDAAPGVYPVNACQAGLETCGRATFQVIEDPPATTTTVLAATTTGAPPTTEAPPVLTTTVAEPPPPEPLPTAPTETTTTTTVAAFPTSTGENVASTTTTAQESGSTTSPSSLGNNPDDPDDPSQLSEAALDTEFEFLVQGPLVTKSHASGSGSAQGTGMDQSTLESETAESTVAQSQQTTLSAGDDEGTTSGLVAMWLGWLGLMVVAVTVVLAADGLIRRRLSRKS